MSPEDLFYYSFLSRLGVEEFVDVPGFERSYQVSNLGSVRSYATGMPKLLSATPIGQKKAYRKVTLGHKIYYIHVLVALAFIGERPSGLQVCHFNDVGSDNRLFNIRYDTSTANGADKRRNRPSKRLDAEAPKSKFASKLTEVDVVNILSLLADTRMSQASIARRFGVTRNTISCISRGVIWQHIKRPEGSQKQVRYDE